MYLIGFWWGSIEVTQMPILTHVYILGHQSVRIWQTTIFYSLTHFQSNFPCGHFHICLSIKRTIIWKGPHVFAGRYSRVQCNRVLQNSFTFIHTKTGGLTSLVLIIYCPTQRKIFSIVSGYSKNHSRILKPKSANIYSGALYCALLLPLFRNALPQTVARTWQGKRKKLGHN